MNAEPLTEAKIAEAFSEGLLTSSARAAEALGIRRDRLLRLAKAGALPSIRIGRSFRFSERMLRDWLHPIPTAPSGEREALRRRMARGIWRSVDPQGRSWRDLLGYDVSDLARHLSRLFRDGMSWSNMAHWHIDHIRPLASFRITGPDCDEFRAAWALSNLQPLWARDNLAKGAKWSEGT